MKTRTRFILPAPKFCGRAVEVQMLSAQMKQDAIEHAMKITFVSRDRASLQIVDPVEYSAMHDAQQRAQVRMFVTRISKKAGMKTQADLVSLSSDDEWIVPTEAKFDEFLCANVCDYEAVSAAYTQMHVVKQTELDVMLGEAMTVSVD